LQPELLYNHLISLSLKSLKWNMSMTTRARTFFQLIIIVVIVGLIFWLLSFFGAFKAPGGVSQIVFRVESSGGYANITLTGDKSQIFKGQSVTTPWEKTASLESGVTVYLTASNPTQAGTITCTIKIDRVVWKTATINAPKDGVACAGIIP
jgi:hypothetical protein